MPPLYLSWLSVIGITAGVLVVLTGWGFVFLRVCPALRLARLPVAQRAEEFFYGVIGYSVAGFAAVLCGRQLDTTFVAGSVIAALTLAFLGPRVPQIATGGADRVARRLSWLAPFVIICGSLLWTVTNLRGLQVTPSAAVLVPWIDFMYHAREISTFGRFDGDLGNLHLTMAGKGLVPYHYLGYMVSALICKLGHLSGIQVATSVYPVLGMMLTGAVMLVWTESRHGAVAAIAGLVLLFLLPDPSCWLRPATRILSYFFFQQVGASGAYATAVCGMALACASSARTRCSLRLTFWAVVLVFIAVQFKIQIVLAYGVVLVVYAWCLSPRISRAMKVAGGVLIVLGYFFLTWRMSAVPNSPTLSLSLQSIERYVPGHPVVAVLLIPIAAIGVWCASYGPLLAGVAVFGWRLRRDSAARNILALALPTLIAQAVVTLLFADNLGYGDLYEINRKTVVLPYFVMVYAAAALTARMLELQEPLIARFSALPSRHWLPALLLLGIAGSAVAAWRVQIWSPRDNGATSKVIPPGLVSSAIWLRSMSGPRDVVQLCENDTFNALATLAERPTYIVKLKLNFYSPRLSAEEQRRFSDVSAISAQPDVLSARRLAQRLNMAWWVESPACKSEWANMVLPQYADGGYRVYGFDGLLQPNGSAKP